MDIDELDPPSVNYNPNEENWRELEDILTRARATANKDELNQLRILADTLLFRELFSQLYKVGAFFLTQQEQIKLSEWDCRVLISAKNSNTDSKNSKIRESIIILRGSMAQRYRGHCDRNPVPEQPLPVTGSSPAGNHYFFSIGKFHSFDQCQVESVNRSSEDNSSVKDDPMSS